MQKTLLILLIFSISFVTNTYSQIGINEDGSNPDPSAMLEVKSTTKGMLVPRMTTAQRTSIFSPATGLLVFDTTTGGFWFYNGTAWVDLSEGTDADADPSNELNTNVALNGTTLEVTDAGGTLSADLASLQDGVNDADADPSNELNTNVTLNGTTLEVTDAGGTLSADLASLQDGVNDADSDPSNELNSNVTLNGTTLEVTDAGGTLSADLASLQDGINDADADPSNELNTNVTLNGTTLEVTDAGGTLSANLSSIDTDTDDQTLSLSGTNLSISEGNTVDLSTLRDHDWYIENTTSIPSDIGNSIYTNGSVGIGINIPAERLSIYPDTDVSAEIGRAHVGSVGHTDWAGFSHIDINTTTGYALLQNSAGRTLLNSSNNQPILFRNNNTDTGAFDQNGNFGVGTIAPDSKVEVVGDVRLNGNNSGVVYENKEINEDWRLVYYDGFEANTENWISNGSLSTGDAGLTRESANIAGLVGHYIRPNDNNNTLKKYFDLSGMTYSEVKIEFNYLFFDSWDTEIGWLAVKGGESGSPTPIWNKQHNHDWADLELNGTTYNVSFYGNGGWSDLKFRGEAQFSWSGGGFWIEFGANLDGDTTDETFAIDNIAVYVR